MNIIVRCKCAGNLLEIDSVEVTKHGIEITVEECDSCAINHSRPTPLAPDAHGLAVENDEESPEFGTGGWMSAR